METLNKTKMVKLNNETVEFISWWLQMNEHPGIKYWNWDVIEACAPFAELKYSHIGFAETEKVNSATECMKELCTMFYSMVDVNAKGNLYVPVKTVKSAIKREQDRFKENNAGGYGRFFARLNYIINTKNNS